MQQFGESLQVFYFSFPILYRGENLQLQSILWCQKLDSGLPQGRNEKALVKT